MCFIFSLMLGALGLLLSVYIKQLENFGTEFCNFSMFFISSALYPLWRLLDNGALFVYYLAKINPFTYGVERLEPPTGKIYYEGILVVIVCTLIFILLAIFGYNPQKVFSKNLKKDNILLKA